VATGKILSQCKNAHNREQFIHFLQQIDTKTSPNLDLRKRLNATAIYTIVVP